MRGPKPKSIAERFWPKVDRRSENECWPWLAGTYPAGYGKFRQSNPRTHKGAHVVAYELTYGPLPEGHLVRHTCDNRPCCNPKHLISGTHADNSNDKWSRKRDGISKIGPLQVIRIRHLLEMGEMTQAEIARMFGIKSNTVSRIKTRHLWRNVA